MPSFDFKRALGDGSDTRSCKGPLLCSLAVRVNVVAVGGDGRSHRLDWGMEMVDETSEG